MAKSKLVEANRKIAAGVVSGYKKIEEEVIGDYLRSRYREQFSLFQHEYDIRLLCHFAGM